VTALVGEYMVPSREHKTDLAHGLDEPKRSYGVFSNRGSVRTAWCGITGSQSDKLGYFCTRE